MLRKSICLLLMSLLICTLGGCEEAQPPPPLLSEMSIKDRTERINSFCAEVLQAMYFDDEAFLEEHCTEYFLKSSEEEAFFSVYAYFFKGSYAPTYKLTLTDFVFPDYYEERVTKTGGIEYSGKITFMLAGIEPVSATVCVLSEDDRTLLFDVGERGWVWIRAPQHIERKTYFVEGIFDFAVATDKEVYQAGEEIQITAQLEYIGDADFIEMRVNKPYVFFKVSDFKRSYAPASQTAMVHTLRFTKGETHEYRFTVPSDFFFVGDDLSTISPVTIEAWVWGNFGQTRRTEYFSQFEQIATCEVTVERPVEPIEEADDEGSLVAE
ncbi:hypothetical protein LJC32_03075 [Oscillospiraceae bacterium OttesenSCG-928-F05]|nr:hypothetical protein [Oscillospiraceae bacterium OttesenSCG-928-F05]